MCVLLSCYEEMLWQAGTRWDVSSFCQSLSLCSHCIYYWLRLPTSGASGCMYGMSVTASLIGSNVMYSFQRKTTLFCLFKFDIIINNQSCIACDGKSLETLCYQNCTSHNWNTCLLFFKLQPLTAEFLCYQSVSIHYSDICGIDRENVLLPLHWSCALTTVCWKILQLIVLYRWYFLHSLLESYESLEIRGKMFFPNTVWSIIYWYAASEVHFPFKFEHVYLVQHKNIGFS